MVDKELSPKICSVTALVSIALHVALVFLVKMPQPPEPQPLKMVEITDLVVPKAPTVPAAIPVSKLEITPPQSSPTVETQSMAQISGAAQISQSAAHIPQKVVQTPQKVVQTSRNVAQASRSALVASEPKIDTQNRPVPLQTSTASPTPAPTSTKSTASGTVSELFAHLGSNSPGTNNSLLSPALFADPSKFFEQGTVSTPTLKSEILRAVSIAGKSPSAVYIDILVTQGQSTNFQVSERGNYGGGTVYQVTQGNQTWYFNLLPTKDTTGTLIVVWQNDPSVSVQ